MLGGEKLSSTSLAHAQEMLASSAAPGAAAQGAMSADAPPAMTSRCRRHAGRRLENRARHRHLRLRQVGRAARARGRRLLSASTTCRPSCCATSSGSSGSGRTAAIAIAVDVRSAASLPHLLPLLAQLRSEGVAVHADLPRRHHRGAGAALLRDAPRPSARGPRRAGRGDRARARAARRAARGLDRARHQPAPPDPAAQLDARAGARARQPADAGVRELRLRHGVPLDADYVFDVRVLPNPHYVPRAAAPDRPRRAGRRLPGGAARRDRDAGAIAVFLRRWLPAFKADQRAT